MTSDMLDAFTTTLAAHLAHTSELPPEQAEQLVGDLVVRARAEYAESGAVYGDDALGFLRWLSEQRAVRIARRMAWRTRSIW